MEVLSVLQASCKDCHRCLRHCPVGAIGFGEDQARIVHEKCIYCGRCVNVCPQGAQVPFNGIAQLEEFLQSDGPVIASVAPSFVAALELADYRQLVGGLKALGFTYVTETVHGAQYVAEEYLRLARSWGRPLVSACCPTIVSLVEKHYPEMIPNLAPIQSPMMVHGQVLRQMFGEKAKVVFIGPCLGKMDELQRTEAEAGRASCAGIDLVMTFRQLTRLVTREGIDLGQVQPADFDYAGRDLPRNYALRGGTLAASAMEREFGEENVLAVSGIEECIQTMKDIQAGRIRPVFLEMLACAGGCINGPEVEIALGVATRRQRVLKYTRQRALEADQANQAECGLVENGSTSEEAAFSISLNLHREYRDRRTQYPLPAEEEVREILRRIGKFSADDETNCGGCGYPTCREKAIAVYQGFAEEKMCIPFMKQRIESLAHVIVESSHNGIIVVNRDLVIQEFNPAANWMFNRKKESPIGQALQRYVDPEPFERVLAEKKGMVHRRVKYPQYNLVADQTIFYVKEYGVIIGIFTDVTIEEEQREKVSQMKKLAMEKAAGVVHKQMKIVQEIAGLLGETTVETKAALYELTQLLEDGDKE